MIVEYELIPTEKGYSAKKIDIKSEEEISYTTPDTVYTSKYQDIKGWETLSRSGWLIGTSTRDNLDGAVEELKEIADAVGANALLDLRYSKTTESEASDSSSGTHYYTMHHYWAEPALIGKKSLNGTLLKSEIPNLESIFTLIYQENEEKNRKAFHKKVIWWIIVLSIALFLLKYQWPSSFYPNFKTTLREQSGTFWWLPSALTVGAGMFIQSIFSNGDYNSWLRRKSY